MTILINFLLVIEAIVAILMMLVILMQRPKSEGLGAAFGGGVTENIFGAQTTNVLTTITTWLASIFFVLVLALSVLYAHRSTGDSAVRRELMKTSAAQKAAAPLPAKDAAKGAAADAKAKLNPAAKESVPPAEAAEPSTAPATSPGAASSPAAAAVSPAAGTSPAASAQPTP